MTLTKFICGICGGILVGFGLGIMGCQNGWLSAQRFEIAMVLSLILGGFFIALGLPSRTKESQIEQLPPQQ